MRLKEIGAWMDRYGESIYGTSASPFFKLLWGRCTQKVYSENTILYLHVFQWPENGRLTVPGLKNRVIAVGALADGMKLDFERQDTDVAISAENITPDPYSTVLKMEIEGKPEAISNMPAQNTEGDIFLPVAYGFIHNRGYGEHAYLSDLASDACLENWVDGGTYLEYMFEVTTPGEFSVWVDGSTQVEDMILTLSYEGKDYPLNFKGTGDLAIFDSRKVGDVEISGTGVQVLTLKAEVAPRQQLKMRSIKLEKL